MWKNQKAKKRNALADRSGMGAGVRGEVQCDQALIDGLLPFPQMAFVVGVSRGLSALSLKP
jgi:hypothetical protein